MSRLRLVLGGAVAGLLGFFAFRGALHAADEAGFQPIFDGRTLAGWDGDPTYWRVENGNLVGEVTPATILHHNSFIIWRGGTTRDFELLAQYRISDRGNSGINYRSEEVPGVRWALRGYQADIDGQNRYTGQNYEERGRKFIAHRGQITDVPDGRRPTQIAVTGDADLLKGAIRTGDWNEYHLIVRGNVMMHILNGRLMSMAIDDDVKNRKTEGLLGMQVHTGPPMKVEFRNLRLRPL
ncbi:MAG TPA: DUF1080 domain-containing protein [Myxococcales bacterium]|jgi:hypothetical protein